MSRKYKIAICQFDSELVENDVKQTFNANLIKMRGFVAEAAEARAHIVVFPEYFLAAGQLSFDSLEKEYEQDLCEMAREHNIDIVAGSIVQSASLDSDVPRYNACFYISRTGKILHVYRKKNLWHPEKEFLTASTDNHQVFETEYFKAGLLICWDMAWPEAFRELIREGAEVVFVPTYWLHTDIGEIGLKHDTDGKAEASFLDSMVVSRAYENECVVVFVNCAGPAKKGFLGRSAVAMPFKGALTKIAHSEQEMRIVDVDLAVLDDARKVYKIREDLSKELNAKK